MGLIVAELTPTQRRAARANVRRLAVIAKLSPLGLCARCGGKHPREELSINYTEGCNFKPNRMGRWDRVVRYERDLAAGVEMRALCRVCASAVGAAYARSA